MWLQMGTGPQLSPVCPPAATASSESDNGGPWQELADARNGEEGGLPRLDTEADLVCP